jgi:hypothetical protein
VSEPAASGRHGPRRRTSQALLPLRHPGRGERYDLYPASPVRGGRLATGWDAVAAIADGAALLLVDGGAGVDWAAASAGLEAALRRRGRRVPACGTRWRRFAYQRRSLSGSRRSLGGDDPVFGKRFEGALDELLELERLRGARRTTGRRRRRRGLRAGRSARR